MTKTFVFKCFQVTECLSVAFKYKTKAALKLEVLLSVAFSGIQSFC